MTLRLIVKFFANSAAQEVMVMEYETLVVERDGNVAIVRINRPKVMNALNTTVLNEIRDVFNELNADDEIHCCILTGEGRAFVAGADIAEMKEFTGEQARVFSANGQDAFRTIERIDKPVIGAINGFALGGGLELAMACDFRIASDKAKFGQPEVTLGVIPGFCGTGRLRRLVGEGNARMLLLTGEMIVAQDALRMGLIQAIIPHDALMEEVLDKAKSIASRGPASIRLMKKILSFNAEVGLEGQAVVESIGFGACFATGETKEGMGAFLEKRPPDWKAAGK
jgi:enoyl-CoA hydratase